MIVIVLTLIVLIVLAFIWHSNKAEAPVVDTHGAPISDHGAPVTPAPAQDTTSAGMEENPANLKVSTSTQVKADASGVKEFVVSGQNFSFTPNVINVNKGDKVRIIFENTSGMHNLTIDEFGVASQTKQSPYQEILEFTASKSGSFQYYCSVGNHRAMGMVGTLNVK